MEYWKHNFGKRPEEELYYVVNDPFCENNLAGDPLYSDKIKDLKETLYQVLEEEEDPRILGNGDIFERYPYMNKQAGFYERYMSGEKLSTPWVQETDYEEGTIEDEAKK